MLFLPSRAQLMKQRGTTGSRNLEIKFQGLFASFDKFVKPAPPGTARQGRCAVLAGVCVNNFFSRLEGNDEKTGEGGLQ
jgi:hypothetical protein